MKYKCIKGFSAITYESENIDLNIEKNTIWEYLGRCEFLDGVTLKSSNGIILDICYEMLTECFKLYKEMEE